MTKFWGTPAQSGSLCNLREVIQRTSVDTDVKVFNVGDEFVMHAFKGHLISSIMTNLKIKSVDDQISHCVTDSWLQETAEILVTKTLMPTNSTDPVFKMHRLFLHHAFLYVDLRETIRWENGPQVVRHWKYWLPHFLAEGCTIEAVHLISNLIAVFPKHIAYIATHNRTVNMSRRLGHAKPVDQLIEHYNL